MPLSLQEQARIVRDIEIDGGRRQANFLRICNRDWNFYGKPGPQRRRAQVFFDNLKKKKIGNYYRNNIIKFDGKLPLLCRIAFAS